MADLDDGPGQTPLTPGLICHTILEKLPSISFDRIYTHSPRGEYTRHLRHEETGRALLQLWIKKDVKASEVCLFAYEDGCHKYLPRPISEAQITLPLPEEIWRRKYRIIREIYNFGNNTFEAKTTPRVEAFWLVPNRISARQWLNDTRSHHESSGPI